MRILHVDPERGWAGGETQVLGLMRYLRGWGHDCELACAPGGGLEERAKEAGFVIHPLSVRNDLDVLAAARLQRLMHTNRFDIVHFHTGRAHALSLWMFKRPDHTRGIATRRMDYPIRKGVRSALLFNRRVQGVVAISRCILDLLVKAGVRKERIHLIPSGVELDVPTPSGESLRRHWNVDSAENAIGVIASLHPRKGHAVALRAARILKDRRRRVKWIFCGEGPEKQRLIMEAASLGMGEDVIFDGFRSDIRSVISAVEVCVLPSLMEGLGVSLLEAMGLGKPVVASRVGGIPEIVRDGKTGFLVPPGSSQGIADRLDELLLQEELRTEMGRNGRMVVEAGFTMEGMARKNELLYRLLAESSRP